MVRDPFTGREMSMAEVQEKRMQQNILKETQELNRKLDNISHNSSYHPHNSGYSDYYSNKDKDSFFEAKSKFVDNLSIIITKFVDKNNLHSKVELRKKDFSLPNEMIIDNDDYLCKRFSILLRNNSKYTKACLAIDSAAREYNVFVRGSEETNYISNHLKYFDFEYPLQNGMTTKQKEKFKKDVIKKVKDNYKIKVNEYMNAFNEIIDCTVKNELAAHFLEFMSNSKIGISFTDKMEKNLKKCGKIFNHVLNPYSKAFKAKARENINGFANRFTK